MKTKIISIITFAVLSFVGFACAKEESKTLNWSTDYAASVEKAKAENKPLIIYFTGSDWCPYCMYMDRDVLSKPDFIDFANKNYVMVLCDFPKKNKPSEKVLAENEKLSQKFAIRGFPTVVIMNAKTEKVAYAGYENGITPKSFMDLVASAFAKLGEAK